MVAQVNDHKMFTSLAKQIHSIQLRPRKFLFSSFSEFWINKEEWLQMFSEKTRMSIICQSQHATVNSPVGLFEACCFWVPTLLNMGFFLFVVVPNRVTIRSRKGRRMASWEILRTIWFCGNHGLLSCLHMYSGDFIQIMLMSWGEYGEIKVAGFLQAWSMPE